MTSTQPAYPQPTYPQSAAPNWPVDPAAPFGRDPWSGVPYSDKSKIVAGILQLFIPFGVGRFYTGHTGMAVAQLLLTFIVVGAIWSFIDGIVILAGRPTDAEGRMLRP